MSCPLSVLKYGRAYPRCLTGRQSPRGRPRSPAATTVSGKPDIVYCYRTLSPQESEPGIEDLSKACGDTLLETCVNGKDNGDINLLQEDQSSYNQSYTGLGCWPGRDWIMAELRKYFPYVYITATQPDYPDFELEWPVTGDTGRNARAVFVASRRSLNLPALLITCPTHQTKIEPVISAQESSSLGECHAELDSASWQPTDLNQFRVTSITDTRRPATPWRCIKTVARPKTGCIIETRLLDRSARWSTWSFL